MNRKRFGCVAFLAAVSCSLAVNSLSLAEEVKGKLLKPSHKGHVIAPDSFTQPKPGQGIAPDMLPHPKNDLHELESPKIKDGKGLPKAQDAAKAPEVTKEIPVKEIPIENVVAVTTEQLVNKPQEYLNKNVKFTAPFFAFSNLALDYKPAFRSSRTYLSFLVLRPNTHTPFSEIKMALLVPKEKDPQTKLLQTLKEGDVIEITGKVFACPLDEPWLDVLRLKKIVSNTKKGGTGEEKSADSSDESKDE